MSRKNTTYVLDTNVLLCDGAAFKKFDKANVVIPIGVLEELDKHKNDRGEVGLNARIAIRLLDEVKEKGSLMKGVKVKTGLTVSVHPHHTDEYVDNQIVDIAAMLVEEGHKVVVVSNDINLRVKADARGVSSTKYSETSVGDEGDIYSGIRLVKTSSLVINQLHAEGSTVVGAEAVLAPNEFVHLRAEENNDHTAIARLCKDGVVRKVRPPKEVFGISSKNMEQACALDALLDADIPLVTLMGKAGTGKTLIGLAAALEMVLVRRKYTRLIVLRPPIPMGKDIGYLPGSLEEKMDVWAGPIFDSLAFLAPSGGKQSVEALFSSGEIEIAPPTYIRGRSLHNCVVLVDEAQGLTPHEMKTIVTRMGQNSKLIVTGDINQIDSPQMSASDNGLTHLVERFRPEILSAHIKLTKSERSDLAARAAEIL